ncbi:MAG: M20/M25/M40 family metallo-hydrolase [Acidobacteria bacterium]|nr:M20/M25/M40 family metallo-hydrolase [Acidobacteriota bacterium]MCZ6751918.1 M20/M25/M40 family metallo-hydrolase [Acidobacteriota bacterium]
MSTPLTPPGATRRQRISSLQEIEELPGLQKVVRSLHEQREWLDRVHIELTEIPAPTFLETERASYMAERFRELGLERVRVDSAGNLLGERPGMSSGLIAVTAHLDTVSPPGMPIVVKRENGRFCAPGISDNGAGLAALLGTAAAVQHSRIETDLSLLFVANVGEEGEGNLCGMRHLFAQREISERVQGVLVLDGANIKHTAIAGLGSRRFLIEITGPGGHSWSDFGAVNPIHALALAVTQLNEIDLPSNPRTSLNIGAIQGGTTVNSIPQSAWMKVDIRSSETAMIQQLSLALESAIQAGVEKERQRGSGRLEATIAQIGDRPVAELPPSARILEVIREVDQSLGIQGRLECSSTDANIPLSLGIEAVATGGGGSGGGAHTPDEWYHPQGRELGLQRILLIVLRLTGVFDEDEAEA